MTLDSNVASTAANDISSREVTIPLEQLKSKRSFSNSDSEIQLERGYSMMIFCIFIIMIDFYVIILEYSFRMLCILFKFNVIY